MPTLYRKYRPQNFNDFFGQEHLTQTLTNEIKNNRISHAYIFSGPRGVGKTTLARLFAKAINCQNRQDGEVEPCDKCNNCLEISQSRNIDVMEMDAASHTGVDNVRENIIDNAQFKPTNAKYKVFIIDEVHMLSTSSFNALLKTLEEPPAHVVFILATTEWHKIPATIISRCQRFNFTKIPREIMKKKLKNIAKDEDIKVDDEVWERIIAKSDGCLRDAESLLGQLFSLGLKEITTKNIELVLPPSHFGQTLEFIKNITNKNTAEALNNIQDIADGETHWEQFALDLVEFLRKLLIAKIDTDYLNTTDLSDEHKKQTRKILEGLEVKKIIEMIDLTIKRKNEIRNSPVPQLPMEMLAVELAGEIIGEPKETTPEIKIEEKIATPKKEPSEENTEPIETIIEVEAEPICSPKNEATSSGKIFSLSEVNDKWAGFLKEMTEVCPSLVFILNMAELKSMEKNCLEIGVQYSFHKEKLEQSQNFSIITQCLKKVFGENIRYKTVVEKKDNNQELTDLAMDFGGEVI